MQNVVLMSVSFPFIFLQHSMLAAKLTRWCFRQMVYISSTSFYSWLRGQSRQIGSSLWKRKFHKEVFFPGSFVLMYCAIINILSGETGIFGPIYSVYGHVHFCVIDMFNILISGWIVFFQLAFTSLLWEFNKLLTIETLVALCLPHGVSKSHSSKWAW